MEIKEKEKNNLFQGIGGMEKPNKPSLTRLWPAYKTRLPAYIFLYSTNLNR